MSTTFLKKTIAFALFLGLTIPTIASAAAPEFEINFQSLYTGPHIFNLEIGQPWTKEIEEKSNGRIVAHFFMSGSLMKVEEVVTGLMKGTLDLAGSGTRYDPNVFPLAQHIAAPYMARDAIHATAIFNKLYQTNPQLKKEIDTPGQLIAMWGGDRTGLFSTRGPITQPADLKGKRVLIWSGAQVDQIKAWGGIPVQVTPNDTYIALQRGMGDVFFGPLPVGVSYKVMEVAKDITIIPALSICSVIWMSRELFDDMPKDLQDIVLETTKDWGTRTGEALVKSTDKDIITMKSAGCKIVELSPEQINLFKEADTAATTEYMTREMKRLNIDITPEEWLKHIYDVAATL